MSQPKRDRHEKRGRKPVWKEKAESRITVPYDLAHQPRQKEALAGIWSALREEKLGLTDLAKILNQNGVSWIQHLNGQCKKRLCRKYSTAVAASFGVVSSSEADSGGYEEVDLLSELIQEPDRTILLEVVGDSMLDDGIYPGSLLVVETRDTHNKSWLEPNNRDYVIALINGSDLTVKQFRRFENGCYLVPRNRKNAQHQPILIKGTEETSNGADVEILGIVKSVTQKL